MLQLPGFELVGSVALDDEWQQENNCPIHHFVHIEKFREDLIVKVWLEHPRERAICGFTHDVQSPIALLRIDPENWEIKGRYEVGHFDLLACAQRQGPPSP